MIFINTNFSLNLKKLNMSFYLSVLIVFKINELDKSRVWYFKHLKHKIKLYFVYVLTTELVNEILKI